MVRSNDHRERTEDRKPQDIVDSLESRIKIAAAYKIDGQKWSERVSYGYSERRPSGLVRHQIRNECADHHARPKDSSRREISAATAIPLGGQTAVTCCTETASEKPIFAKMTYAIATMKTADA